MEKILVTGGTGYIGSHTCVELISAGYEPIIVDNLCNSKVEVLNRIEKITGKRPVFYENDVRDEEKMNKIFEENNIFVSLWIIHVCKPTNTLYTDILNPIFINSLPCCCHWVVIRNSKLFFFFIYQFLCDIIDKVYAF